MPGELKGDRGRYMKYAIVAFLNLRDRPAAEVLRLDCGIFDWGVDFHLGDRGERP